MLSHERDPDAATGLRPAAIERAHPRSLPRVPADVAEEDQGGAERSGSIAGRPPSPLAARLGPFQSGRVDDPTAYPYSANGRLFGRFRGLGAFSCSASVIRARNRSVIFTAGHCVKRPGRGGWVRRLTFVPAYSDGARPFGRWQWKVVYTTKQWGRLGDPSFDYAAVVLKRNRGRRIADETGALGLAWGAKRNRTYRAVGYPQNKAGGERMWECRSGYEGRDPFHRGRGPAPIGIGCDMKAGASGGGWMIFGDRVASLSSFALAGRPNELYGPRFTKRAEQMRRRAQRE